MDPYRDESPCDVILEKRNGLRLCDPLEDHGLSLDEDVKQHVEQHHERDELELHGELYGALEHHVGSIGDQIHDQLALDGEYLSDGRHDELGESQQYAQYRDELGQRYGLVHELISKGLRPRHISLMVQY